MNLPDFRVTVVVSLIYVASLIAMQVNGWHSDHVREHRWHTALPSLLCGACLLLVLAFQPGTWPTAVLLGVANGCLLAFVTSFWAIPSFLGESAGAASTGLINCIALTGRFTGPYLNGPSHCTHPFIPRSLCVDNAHRLHGGCCSSARTGFVLSQPRIERCSRWSFRAKSLASQPASLILKI